MLDSPELMDTFLPMLRADFRMADEYHVPSGEQIRIPITAYGGTADTDVSITQARTWHTRTRGGFASRSFNGDHFFLHEHREALVIDILSRWSPVG